MSVKGKGTKLYSGDRGATPAWAQVANVIDITPPTEQVEDIETTDMDSTDGYKEFEPGYVDGGEVTATLKYAKAKNTTVRVLLAGEKAFKIEFSDGSSWAMDGYVKGFGNKVERNGIVTIDVTIKVTGKPVFTAAA